MEAGGEFNGGVADAVKRAPKPKKPGTGSLYTWPEF
jgi:hypothetical protein